MAYNQLSISDVPVAASCVVFIFIILVLQHTTWQFVCMKSGANIGLSDNLGKTALHWATNNGHLDIVGALLDAGDQLGFKDADQYSCCADEIYWSFLCGNPHASLVDSTL